MLSVSARAQIHEVGKGVPVPIRAPHLTAELIADSGTTSPGGPSAMAGVTGDMPLRQGVSRAESEGRTNGAFGIESTDRRGARC